MEANDSPKVVDISRCPKTGWNRRVCFCKVCRPVLTEAEAVKILRWVGLEGKTLESCLEDLRVRLEKSS